MRRGICAVSLTCGEDGAELCVPAESREAAPFGVSRENLRVSREIDERGKPN